MMKKVFIALSLLFLLFANSLSALTPAFTQISNQAKMTYEDESGNKYTSFSNTVIIKVLPVYDIYISEDGTKDKPGFLVKGFPNSYVYIPYTLTNTGNTKDNYNLNVEIETSLSLPATELFIDKNSNGKIDTFETIYNNSKSPVLIANESVQLLVKVKLPNVQSGDVFVNLTGVSNSDNSKIDNNNIAKIEISSDGILKTTKEADKSQASPNEEVTFDIYFQNIGNNPLKAVSIPLTDFDNNGEVETLSGLLLEDDIPEKTEYVFHTVTHALSKGITVFKGDDDIWRTDEDIINNVIAVGLYIPEKDISIIEPDQKEKFSFKVKVDKSALIGNFTNQASIKYANEEGEQEAQTNEVIVKILPRVQIKNDDTDDLNEQGVEGGENDDDTMKEDEAVILVPIDFLNEVWNLGNGDDVINLEIDVANSENLPTIYLVNFLYEDGTQMGDSNGDGLPDMAVKVGEVRKYITQVLVKESDKDLKDVKFAVNAISTIDPTESDLTFNELEALKDVQIRVQLNTDIKNKKYITEALGEKRVIVTKFDKDGTKLEEKVFFTDKNGYIRYDENNNSYPLYNWIGSNAKYRVTIPVQQNGKTYYASTNLSVEDLNQVIKEGDTYNKENLSVEKLQGAVTLATFTLNSAGYVYDGKTGEKVNGACVAMYKCNDGKACSNYVKVDPLLLGYYTNETLEKRQNNPQLSGSLDIDGIESGKSNGEFQFQYKSFDTSVHEGYYFIEVTFDCKKERSTRAIKYEPVVQNKSKTWNVLDNKPYNGELFYLNNAYSSASFMPIPLGQESLEKLKATKTASLQVANIGDYIQFEITIENPNPFNVSNMKIIDIMPRELRYKSNSTILNGTPYDDANLAIASDGRTLTWTIGDLNANESVTLSYYAQIGAGSGEGKKTNIAYAAGIDTSEGTAVESNRAEASFKIKKGVFSDQAFIIGKAFIDQNDNKIQDENEPGVKNIKIYMEDGRFVVTDSNGKYHLDNVRPGTHVLKLDMTSVPNTLIPVKITNRFMDNNKSQFVDTRPGDMFKANFRFHAKEPTLSGPIVSEGELALPDGKIKFQRYINSIVMPADGGDMMLKQKIVITNMSDKPLYELEYSEQSDYTPNKGTLTINNAPAENPSIVDRGFDFGIALLEPQENVDIDFTSKIPTEDQKVDSNIAFLISPYDNAHETIKLRAPITFSMPGNKIVSIRVHFPFGKYYLTKRTKRALDKIIKDVRKINYEKLYIKMDGHTDSIHIKKGAEFKTNLELSKLRAESVKKYLEQHFIDLSKVEINHEK